MIVVDTSVWIDYFNGVATAEAEVLDRLLGTDPVALGDVNLVEILQGFRHDRDAVRARELLLSLDVLPMLGVENALQAAHRSRMLRSRGITIRKTNDVIIASYCISHGHSLLFADRDFLPFVEFLGLRTALPGDVASG